MPRLEDVRRWPAGQIRFDLVNIPGGQAGTDATVRKIAQLVDQAVRQQKLRLVALRILDWAGAENHSDTAAAKAIFRWVKHHIRYVRDPAGLETVQAPEVTLQLRAGDCDDHTALVAALAAALAIPVRYVVVGPSKGRFVHIFPQVFVGNAWFNSDTTMRGRFAGDLPKLPAVNYYTVKGSKVMGLGENVGTGPRALPITREQLFAVAYDAAKRTIRNNWKNAVINRADIEGYVATIDEGNSPFRFTFADQAMRQAALDVLDDKNRSGQMSPKGEAAPMGDLGFFMGSVISAVGKAVTTVAKTAYGAITGGGGQPPIQITLPDITIPRIETNVPPASARAGVAELLSSPVVLVGLGLLAVMVLRR